MVTVASAFNDIATPTNLLLGMVALALLLVGVLGGWNNLADKTTKVSAVPPRREITANPLKVTLTRALTFENQPKLLLLDHGERAIMIGADLLNTSERPLLKSDVQQTFLLSIPGLKGLDVSEQAKASPSTIMRASDTLPLTALQPGLKTRVALLWVQDTAQPAPQNLTVTVLRQTYRKSSLSNEMAYFDPTEVATVTLPVKPLGGAP